MGSIKTKWFELGQLENAKQVEYLKELISLYNSSPSSHGLLYMSLVVLSLIFLSYGYWIVFGSIFWIFLALFIHTIVFRVKVSKFKKKWGLK